MQIIFWRQNEKLNEDGRVGRGAVQNFDVDSAGRNTSKAHPHILPK